MTNTTVMKKDLQKIVKKYRDSKGTWQPSWSKTPQPYEFPRAMMTGQQMMNNTATINFGRADAAEQEAEKFMESEDFRNFAIKNDIRRSIIELNSDQKYQIRIQY